jgi:O-Antigen ligase
LSPVDRTPPEGGWRLREIGIWGAPLAVVFVVWLWLAFSSGGYMTHQWLLPSVTLGFLGLVVSLLTAYPRRPRQLSLAVLLLFGLYSIWVAFSALWADSVTRVWLESGRTFFYLLLLALAVIYLSDRSARVSFRYLLMAATLVILVACVVKLYSTDNISALFLENRLVYPISYPNNAAALFLVALWPLMWLAAGPEERAPVRGIALGLATGLLGLAVMTQSRGAFWSLAIAVLFTFVVSPARLRTLFYLLVPAILMVYEFPRLNRYWLEGPEAVGGGLAVRTLVAASLTAAFIGMILALLERWVKVSRRMKVIFGTIVVLGVIGGLVYGVSALTRDAGGPLKWVSQTWRQFTDESAEDPEAGTTTRFTMVTSSGRVEIWRVALRELEDAPILGVGADNFVFQYDRLRTSNIFKPQQAHSYELQVLGETGVIGGVFAFGGILLTLGGLLWPRCSAGWRGARETWLRRRRRMDPAEPTRVSTRWCNPRWGDDAVVYGWEMALLAGAVYWLVHASVDWLWQMPGVSIPAVLFAAAGVASVDARAGVLWPRLSRRLRMRPPAPGAASADSSREQPADGATTQPTDIAPSSDTSTAGEGLLPMVQRPHQSAVKRQRRERRRLRKTRSEYLLQPPGVLSLAFQALLVTLSLIVIISAGLPYLSLQYQKSALALAKTDGLRAVDRAGAARWFQPADPNPYLTQAGIYSRAASAAALSGTSDRAGAVLDNLSLSINKIEEAISYEPSAWSLHYRAGVAALNLLIARECATGLSPELDYPTLVQSAPGVEDWSGLAGLNGEPPDPGVAAGSLAAKADTRDICAYYRGLSQADLAQLALDFLAAAEERNPLATQIAEAAAVVRHVQGGHTAQ